MPYAASVDLMASMSMPLKAMWSTGPVPGALVETLIPTFFE
jgi:hypothetical protein